MKYILVTGATEFIGRHIVQSLRNQGFKVAAIIREGGLKNQRNLSVYNVDITKPEQFYALPKTIDGVIHTAAFIPPVNERQYVLPVQSKATSLYLIGSGEQTSLTKLAKLLVKLMPATKIVYDGKKPDDPQRLCFNYSKAYTVLGYTPKWQLLEGLQQLV